jgi:hypothetical protein
LDGRNKEEVSMTFIRLFVLLAVLQVVVWFPNRAWGGYEDSFRCKTDVIMLGDSNYRVLAKCGPPSAREFIGTNYLYGHPAGEFRDVEQWLYNMGPTDFVYTLKFQGGALYEIYRGSRGF